MKHLLIEKFKRIKAISDVGLLYASSEYEKERYLELRQISLDLMQEISGLSLGDLQVAFPVAAEYPTAKVDIRGLVLSEENRVLLVKEMADGKWSLPGGWADVGFSPAEVIAKEVKEETGLDISVERLVAVFDKRKHHHPPQAAYVYKMVFYCKAPQGQLSKGFDVLDAAYFPIDNLPPLSEDRILKDQIELVFKKVIKKDFDPYFD
jgi:ADP-ribose pyrophosphatase YjhB (NUDIX family)